MGSSSRFCVLKQRVLCQFRRIDSTKSYTIKEIPSPNKEQLCFYFFFVYFNPKESKVMSYVFSWFLSFWPCYRMALMESGRWIFSLTHCWHKLRSSGALRTTSGVQTGGRVCRCRRPARRAWTVWRPWTSLPTRLCLETSSTATTTTPKRAPQDRSSGPPSGEHRAPSQGFGFLLR